MSRYTPILAALTVLLLLFLTFSPGVEAQLAQQLRLDSVHYQLGADLSNISDFDITALQLDLNFGITRINSFAGVLNYDADDLNLQGVWLINFTEGIRQDMNLRLNLSTIDGFSQIEPGLGLGGRFPAGETNYIFANLDYFFNLSGRNLIYTAGLGIPITVNSNLTLSAGRSLWNRDGHQLNIGMEIEF